MRLYRVHYLSGANGSAGFAFFSNKRRAELSASSFRRAGRDRDDTKVERIEFRPTLKGVRRLLSLVADHPDNG